MCLAELVTMYLSLATCTYNISIKVTIAKPFLFFLHYVLPLHRTTRVSVNDFACTLYTQLFLFVQIYILILTLYACNIFKCYVQIKLYFVNMQTQNSGSS